MEQPPNMESSPVQDTAVIDAFRVFAERGVTRPEELDRNDPEVQEADKLLERWAEENPELGKTALREMLYIRAGFHDPDYLDEVAHDWLAQDLDNVAGNASLTEKVEGAISEIERLLSQE